MYSFLVPNCKLTGRWFRSNERVEQPTDLALNEVPSSLLQKIELFDCAIRIGLSPHRLHVSSRLFPVQHACAEGQIAFS